MVATFAKPRLLDRLAGHGSGSRPRSAPAARVFAAFGAAFALVIPQQHVHDGR